MSKSINTSFKVNAPFPLDTRTQVSTFAGLSQIAVKYEGLKVYVKDEDKEYRYYNTGWQEWSPGGGGGAGVWGSITGTLSDQTDLQNALNLKFNVAGGTITGKTIVLDEVEAYNFLIYGSGPTVDFPYVQSTIVGEPTGSIAIQNIVGISQVDYDNAVIAGSLVAGTHYLII